VATHGVHALPDAQEDAVQAEQSATELLVLAPKVLQAQLYVTCPITKMLVPSNIRRGMRNSRRTTISWYRWIMLG